MEQKKMKKRTAPHGTTIHSKPEPCGWSQNRAVSRWKWPKNWGDLH